MLLFRGMRLLILLPVYEPEARIAPKTLNRFLELAGEHDISLHITDDASPQFIGNALQTEFSDRISFIHVERLERSAGYLGTSERTLSALSWAASRVDHYDYVLRLDCDVHFLGDGLTKLLRSPALPRTGMVGPRIKMRSKDFAAVLLDLLPFGYRRTPGQYGLTKEITASRLTPVWWSKPGRAALANGWWREVVVGAFQLMSAETLKTISESGYLNICRSRTGLIFQDDVLTTMLVRAIGHPVLDCAEMDLPFTMFLPSNSTEDAVRASGKVLLHPLKDTAWANRIRDLT